MCKLNENFIKNEVNLEYNKKKRDDKLKFDDFGSRRLDHDYENIIAAMSVWLVTEAKKKTINNLYSNCAISDQIILNKKRKSQE